MLSVRERRAYRRWPKMTAVVFAVLAIMLTLGSLPTASARTTGRSMDKITIAILPAVEEMMLVHVAKAEGYFAKEGFDATIKRFQGGPAVLQAVMAGAAQFAHAGSVPFINATSHGSHLLAFGVDALFNRHTTSLGIFTKKGSGITKISELAGHTLAINQLGDMESIILPTQMYRREHLSPSSIQLEQVPYPLMEQALLGGRVDSVVSFAPFTQAMADNPKIRVLGYLDHYIPDPGYVITFAIAQSRYAKKHPGAVKRYISAINDALGFYRAHPKQAATITAKAFHLPGPLVAAALQSVKFPKTEGSVAPEAWKDVADAMKSAGDIPRSYDMSKHVRLVQ